MRLPLPLLVALQISAVFSLTSCGYQYFKRITIDPTSLQVSCHDSVGGLFNPAPPEGVYARLATWNGLINVEYLDKASSASWVRYDSMMLDEDEHLIERTKYQILAEGDFGRFYAKTYYYYRPNTANRIDFSVTALYTIQSEPPQVTESTEPIQGTLSVISIIRVFRTSAGHTEASACYASTGQLLNVSHRKVQNDESGPGSETRYGQNLEPERFGFPPSFPVKEYGQGDRGVLVSSDPNVIFEAVSFHYDRNRQVQQDFRNRGEEVHSRILRYKITPDDRMLAAIDNRRLFADYRPSKKEADSNSDH